MLKGLYLCLDYNHNPIARRIVLVKQSDSTDVNPVSYTHLDVYKRQV